MVRPGLAKMPLNFQIISRPTAIKRSIKARHGTYRRNQYVGIIAIKYSAAAATEMIDDFPQSFAN
ncbi:MAG: hypothetical protein WAK66_06300 [Methylocystis sp.]